MEQEQIELAYQQLVTMRSEQSPRYAELVAEIALAERLADIRFRADAVWLIANNMFDLVEVPLGIVRQQNDAPDSDIPSEVLVQNMVQTDIMLLAHRAADIARSREKDYVSATSVTLALSDAYPEFKVANAKIWGRFD